MGCFAPPYLRTGIPTPLGIYLLVARVPTVYRISTFAMSKLVVTTRLLVSSCKFKLRSLSWVVTRKCAPGGCRNIRMRVASLKRECEDRSNVQTVLFKECESELFECPLCMLLGYRDVVLTSVRVPSVPYPAGIQPSH